MASQSRASDAGIRLNGKRSLLGSTTPPKIATAAGVSSGTANQRVIELLARRGDIGLGHRLRAHDEKPRAESLEGRGGDASGNRQLLVPTTHVKRPAKHDGAVAVARTSAAAAMSYHGVNAPKSRYGRRDIPLAPRMRVALHQQRRSTSYADDRDPVFATRAGTPLDYACVYHRVLKPAARRAGVPWAAFHKLRHTCATMLFRNGLNAKQVKMGLGHHSPAFTLAVTSNSSAMTA